MDLLWTEERPAPLRVKALMQGFRHAWYLAGGWALDVYLRRATRPHDDVEIAIFRQDQEAIRRHLAGWEFEKVEPAEGSGRPAPWREGERLDPPVHEVHARRRGGDPMELEILLNDIDDGRWSFRRDPRVNRPLAELGLVGCSGIPILAPEVVLLYKAKAPRPKDEEDFRSVREAMGPDRRRWLAEALAKAHPGHPWIRALPP